MKRMHKGKDVSTDNGASQCQWLAESTGASENLLISDKSVHVWHLRTYLCSLAHMSVFPYICRHSPNSSPAQVPHLWADAGIRLEPTARVCLYLPPWSCLVYYLQNRTPGKMSQIVLDTIRYFLSSGATHVHTFPTSCGVNLLTILLIMSSISRWTGWTCVKAKPQR